MGIVQGIGGVFIYADDARALATWYEERFGLTLQKWGECYGCELPSADIDETGRRATTTFSIFPSKESLEGAVRTARINLRVNGLDELIEQLAADGIEVMEQSEDSEYGRFRWVRDPEGNRLELWEPPLDKAGWPEG